jgi:hypothetical protein
MLNTWLFQVAINILPRLHLSSVGQCLSVCLLFLALAMSGLGQAVPLTVKVAALLSQAVMLRTEGRKVYKGRERREFAAFCQFCFDDSLYRPTNSYLCLCF